MSTTTKTDATATIRPGTILDVNAVARLLRASAHAIDVDGDGIPDGPRDPEAAAMASRLVLLHGVLEHGELWVMEAAGEVIGAAVWAPARIEVARDAPTELGAILRRELRVERMDDVAELVGPAPQVRGYLTEAMTGVLQAAADLAVDDASDGALLLYALVLPPGPAHAESRIGLARQLLAPVLAGDQPERPLLALALDAPRAHLLAASGFVTHDVVPLGAANSVWIGRWRTRAPIAV